MALEKHDLVHEFPDLRERIHELKISDRYFAEQFAKYHDLDHEIRRIEMDIEPTSDAYLEDRKKLRLKLKDELYAMLRADPSDS